jgi:hypothetical protein
MSMAMKYRMSKKKDCYADGGEVDASPSPSPAPSAAVSAFMKGFKGAFPGGSAEASEGEDHKAQGGMVEEIVRKRKYSKGGQVANDTGMGAAADLQDNEFDELVKDDSLEEHYTGANSGDEDGDAAEDDDRKDVVSMIMKSRKKKDRMPKPA